MLLFIFLIVQEGFYYDYSYTYSASSTYLKDKYSRDVAVKDITYSAVRKFLNDSFPQTAENMLSHISKAETERFLLKYKFLKEVVEGDEITTEIEITIDTSKLVKYILTKIDKNRYDIKCPTNFDSLQDFSVSATIVCNISESSISLTLYIYTYEEEITLTKLFENNERWKIEADDYLSEILQQNFRRYQILKYLRFYVSSPTDVPKIKKDIYNSPLVKEAIPYLVARNFIVFRIRFFVPVEPQYIFIFPSEEVSKEELF